MASKGISFTRCRRKLVGQQMQWLPEGDDRTMVEIQDCTHVLCQAGDSVLHGHLLSVVLSREAAS